MRAPQELRAIHPLGKSPVITDDGNTIAESGAIVEYLVDIYGNGRFIPPPKTPERLRYTYWLHYAEGSAMPPLLMKLVFTLMPRRAPALLRPLVAKGLQPGADEPGQSAAQAAHGVSGKRNWSKSEWFAGNEFTAADIQMSFPLEAAAARGGLEERPSQGDGVPRAHPRAPGLSTRAGKGRAVSGGAMTGARHCERSARNDDAND